MPKDARRFYDDMIHDPFKILFSMLKTKKFQLVMIKIRVNMLLFIFQLFLNNNSSITPKLWKYCSVYGIIKKIL